jgi:XTP/dITP diphosphohydrolase
MEKLYFITGNTMKAGEVKAILAEFGIDTVKKELDIEEIQSLDAEKIAKKKAMEAFRMVKKPLITEDTGLCIKAMNGYPGPLIKHFYNSIGLQGIADFLKGRDRSAEAITVVAYCDSKGNVKTFEGKVKGRISTYVAAGSKFAWDPIFIPEGYDKTYAEIGAEEKNRISQRRKALEKFAEFFTSHRN